MLCMQQSRAQKESISTSTVAEALLEIFSRVGLPERIHSDRGSQFTSEMMREVYRLLNVQQSVTTPYHAMGNGVVENFNKTIKNLLKKVASEKPKDWHRYLGPLMFAVRDTPQDSTGFTPFELLYGHKVQTPMTVLKRISTGKDENPEVKTAYQYVMSAVFYRHICVIYYCYVSAIVLLLWYACICVLVECCCPILQSVFQRADTRTC